MSDAVTWAKAQRTPSKQAKAVLVALAAYADATGLAWGKVDVLAVEIGGDEADSDRTVQRGLADLRRDGPDGWPLIADSGRKHLYKGKLYPLYQLALERGPRNTAERLEQDRARLAADLGVTQVSPQTDSSGDTDVTPRGDAGAALGVTDVSPHHLKDKTPTEGKLTTGVRAGEAFTGWTRFAGFVEAYPATGLKRTDLPQAEEAFLAEVEAGADPDELVAAARAYAACPMLAASSHGACGAVKFLTGKRWRQYAPRQAARRDGSAITADASRTAFEGPDAVWDVVASAMGRTFATSYLTGAVWDEATASLTTRTGTACDQLRRECRRLFNDLGVTLLAPPQRQLALSASCGGGRSGD